MPPNEYVIMEQDMPWNMQEGVLKTIQSVLSDKTMKKSIRSTMYSASESISEQLKAVEKKDWQVVVVRGSFTSTCVHKPGRLLSVFYKPFSILVWQSK